MAAFGAGLLDDPLGASDWDTDSILAGADCAGASVGAPRAEQSQSAVDVNAMDMDAGGSAGAHAGAWGVAPLASAPLGPLNAPLPMSTAPPMGWSQHGTGGDNVNHLPMKWATICVDAGAMQTHETAMKADHDAAKREALTGIGHCIFS